MAFSDPILAAGGVVVRDGKVLVVHRPHRDDWSLPKGKLDPEDPSLAACALREVWEETGFRCMLGERSILIKYNVPSGRAKEVTFWLMTVESGEFTVNNEVDEIRWLDPADAIAMVDYASDRQSLAELLR
jgi:8-oxo-dGTP diphosphatase